MTLIAASTYHLAPYCGVCLPLFSVIAASAYHICGVCLPLFSVIAASAYHLSSTPEPDNVDVNRLKNPYCGVYLPPIAACAYQVLQRPPTTYCGVYLPRGRDLCTGAPRGLSGIPSGGHWRPSRP